MVAPAFRMRLEHQKIRLESINLDQIRIDRRILGAHGDILDLNDHQIEILEMLRGREMSIHEIVHHYYARGVRVSFESLHEILKFLLKERVVRNSLLQGQLADGASVQPAGVFRRLMIGLLGATDDPIDVRAGLRQAPFFRSMRPSTFAAFLSAAKAYRAPANTVLCKSGAKRRSLYALLRGQASVYEERWSGHRRKLATLAPNSVFGEAGFFFGAPRTADVITDEECVVVQIQYDAEKFEPLIRRAKATQLQQRFWLIHALLTSDIFRKIPSDCFDALVFSGEIRNFSRGEWLCRENEPGATAYVMIKGSVQVSQSGREKGRLTQGDCFGEIALLNTGGRRTASVRCETDVLALEIRSEKFYSLLADHFFLARRLEAVAQDRLQKDRLDRAA